MDTAEFEQALKRDGFGEIETKSAEAGKRSGEHTHPFEVRALVLDGDISLGVGGETRRYGAGEVFTMAPGCTHTEAIGPAGVRYLVGRRHPAA